MIVVSFGSRAKNLNRPPLVWVVKNLEELNALKNREGWAEDEYAVFQGGVLKTFMENESVVQDRAAFFDSVGLE